MVSKVAHQFFGHIFDGENAFGPPNSSTTINAREPVRSESLQCIFKRRGFGNAANGLHGGRVPNRGEFSVQESFGVQKSDHIIGALANHGDQRCLLLGQESGGFGPGGVVGQHGHPKAGGHGIPHATGGHGHELGQHFGFTALQDTIGRRLFHNQRSARRPASGSCSASEPDSRANGSTDGVLDGCGDGAGQFGSRSTAVRKG